VRALEMTLSEQVAHAVPADLSTLAWVADELRRTLDNAHKALRRQVRETEVAPGTEIDGAAAPAMQQARALFHQGAGALDMVGQAEGARMLRASEQAVLRFMQKIRLLDNDAATTIERSSFALLDFLRRRLSGKDVSPIALFPQYREVQTLAGADRIHPADLWNADAQSSGTQLANAAPALVKASAATHVMALQPDADTRGRMEQCMLALLRGPVGPAATQMSQLFAGLAAGASGKLSGLWSVAAAFFEAQAQGRLSPDVYSKRLTSRLLAQVRLAERGQSDVSDRLTQDLLFFCARALPGDDAKAPRLVAVRKAFALAPQEPIDYEQEALGRYDPALIPLARRRVEALKESWSSATAGQSGLAASLREQATLVADSVRKLHPEGEHMARALDAAVTQVAEGASVPSPNLAMEVATSLLCLDAALDDVDIADASFGTRIHQLAERIDLARQGRTPGPIEPWMEDLYRRASDRQTMGSVVQELRSSLADVEGQLDKFSRNPAERELLVPVPAKLSAMRGVLSVLGLDQAGQAVVRMRDEVDTVLAQSREDGDAAPAGRALSEQAVGRLASNVGALGFLIDLLGVQPQLAKSLFKFDPESGRLETVMGRTEEIVPTEVDAPPAGESELMEQVQQLAAAAGNDAASKADIIHKLDELAQQAVASDEKSIADAAKAASKALARSDETGATEVRQEVAKAMHDFVAPPPPAPAPASAVVSDTATAEDDEMLEVFFEEAEEVIAGARESLGKLAEDPQHFESISTVRRAFHTLKGSSRMVGLKDFGEAAWACEQLYNARLADHVIEADPELRSFSLNVLEELEGWIKALATKHASGFHSAPIVAAANALRDGIDPDATPVKARAPVAAPAPAPAPVEATAVLPPMPLPDEAFEPEPEEAGDTEILDDFDVTGPGSLEHAAEKTIAEPREPAFMLDLPSDAPTPAPQAADGHVPTELVEDRTELQPLVRRPDLAAPDFEFDLGDLDKPAAGTHAEHGHDPVSHDTGPDTVPAIDESSFDLLPAERTAEPAANDAGTHAFDTLPVAGQLSADDAENYKVIGPLRISLSLFNIFLNEADEQSRRLCTSLAEWVLELPRPVGEEAVALAHSLAGNSATVGHTDLSSLSRRLEHALEVSQSRLVTPDEARLYSDVAEEIRRLLHQFAAGFLQAPTPALIARFDAFQSSVQAQVAQAAHDESVQHAREAEAEQAAAAEKAAAEAKAVADAQAAEEARIAAEAQAAAQAKAAAEAQAAAEAKAAAEAQAAAQAEAAAEAKAAAEAQAAAEARAAAEAAAREQAAAEAAAAAAAAPIEDHHFADLPIAAAEVIDSPDTEIGADEFEAMQAAADAAPVEPTPAHAVPAAIPASGLGAVKFTALDDTVRVDTGERHQVAEPQGDGSEFTQDLDAHDAIDPELFEIFSEEAQELLPSLASHLRAWEQAPEMNSEAFGALRALHTLKGSARLAGAMRLGELAHRLESAFEERVGSRTANPPTMAMLHTGVDALDEEFQRLLKAPVAAPVAPAPAPAPAPVAAAPAPAPVAIEPVVAAPVAPAPVAAQPAPVVAAAAPEAPVAPAPVPESTIRQFVPKALSDAAPATIDWSRFTGANASTVQRVAEATTGNPATATVRVKAPLLDRLVNQAGEVSITRSRLEADVTQMRASLRELTENLDRLRRQLRDIELQADSQIASRLEASKTSAAEFDPLEMDRFTRFQELTRMMAESVNDVATVQRSITQTVQSAEDEMAAQARLTRALSEDLLRARMVPFDALSERLYRVVRQAAKETSVQVRLNVEGSSIELDRSVLDRMAGAFEHLLRNAVVHGIESPDIRRAQDKDAVGTIDVALAQQGNEVRITIRDDGAGLDLQRIEARGRKNGLIAPDAKPTDGELANLIFTPGFTTAESVTELAGRGVGMDAVRTDITALGGRIETASAPGRGTAFTLLLPLTTAVTRVVQLRCGDLTVAIPASLVEVVRRTNNADVELAYQTGVYRDGSNDVAFFWLGALLQSSTHGTLAGKTTSIVLVRSAEQRVALHVDQVVGNQEVVVKNLGPQLARLPGLAGMSLLATGEVVPIYNPVALAAVYGQRPGTQADTPHVPVVVEEVEEAKAPLILVVDDSLTVRRVTQRLLTREGFRVTVAKDGLDALEQLEVERPAVMLTDIEMPRMDGFDLLRNVRHDPRWQGLPVIMITSRIAQKHRDLAIQLGADHYLGKPYDEEQLIGLIQENVAKKMPA
jgi:chemosensory pili system protein ChpA (sensor histidine kinase/response regulator)